MLDVRVRVASAAGKDATFSVDAAEPVARLRAMVAEHLGASASRLRLIRAGRLLRDGQTVRECGVGHNDWVHATLSPSSGSGGAAAAPAAPPAPVPVPVAGRRGFDVFRRAGLGADEVGVLRAQFAREVEALMAREVPAEPGDAPGERLLRAEERWIASQGTSSELALNVAGLADPPLPGADDGPVGTAYDFFWGVALGSMLSIIMLFWLADSSVPLRQRQGVMFGVMANVLVTMATSGVS